MTAPIGMHGCASLSYALAGYALAVDHSGEPEACRVIGRIAHTRLTVLD